MNRIFTDGIIYKVNKYSDSSAIALAYTKDHGKVKLFIPKAYTKRGGVTSLVPGEIDFLKKDNSDLSKYYGFRPYAEYMHFVDEPAISLRLNLFFDVFDNLYGQDEQDTVIWTLLTRFNRENAPKALIFSIFAMMTNCGVMFAYSSCAECGKEIADCGALLKGQFYCTSCAATGSVKVSETEMLTLRALAKPALYKNLILSRRQEFSMLDILTAHAETVFGKALKSYKSFKELLTTL